MDEHEVDLGKETFLVKWPDWLRWLLFIPAIILVPTLFLAIFSTFNSWFLDLGPNAFYFNLLRGLVFGAGCILVGSMVAPKKQRVVSLVLLIIAAMLTGIALLSEINNFTWNSFLEDIITLTAAGWATHYVYTNTK